MIIKPSFIKAALSLIVGTSLFSFTPEILANQSRILYAGQHTPVGIVELSVNPNDQIQVDYTITEPGWCLNTTHLYVGLEEPAKIAPGQFPYAHEGLGCTQVDSYFYPWEDIPTSECGYVAAHAVVTQWSWPIGGEVTYKVSHTSPETKGVNGLFDGDILIDGEWQRYRARCVDINHAIGSNIPYTCTLYSSLDMNAPVDKPENLDLINYMINHKDEYLNLWGATQKDLMAVGWILIDNETTSTRLKNLLKNYDPDLVNLIIAEIEMNGEGFIPGPDDLIGIIVKCGNKQVTLLEVLRGEIELGSETAWAQASGDFPFLNNKGKPTGWGTYFQCDLN
jgi:hypothetical protein